MPYDLATYVARIDCTYAASENLHACIQNMNEARYLIEHLVQPMSDRLVVAFSYLSLKALEVSNPGTSDAFIC